MENMIPLPNQIRDYPKSGELEHIFRKKLTQTDTQRGLLFTGESNTFFMNTLPQSMRNELSREGSILATLYTPKVSKCKVPMRSRRQDTLGNFMLWKTGWVEILEENGYKSGDVIDCWCVYSSPEEGDNEEIT
ncbi:hypothetical protein Patl1_22609 [Pistacia atlantica]|uniref:Uncharacterized protein n=1 Tax=Pistacia atlantica TaxID=434234 RepID=A0ACC0ZWS1_9ROSI|nr:hypothetical protein Patl1_22609 [Pistacia atlantica]